MMKGELEYENLLRYCTGNQAAEIQHNFPDKLQQHWLNQAVYCPVANAQTAEYLQCKKHRRNTARKIRSYNSGKKYIFIQTLLCNSICQEQLPTFSSLFASKLFHSTLLTIFPCCGFGQVHLYVTRPSKSER